jgi:hypothetical protein
MEPNRARHAMRCLAFLVPAAVAVVGCGASAQDATAPGEQVNCADVGFPGIRVEVRRGDGRPIAAGATLIVTDGNFKQTTVETWSALSLEAADNRTGTYTVEVSKPFYKTVRIDRVSVPGGPCGAYHTVTVPITLDALPTAPQIRSVSVAQPGVGLDAGLHNQYTVWVDATPGADTSVTWSLSDPRVATIDQSGFLTAKCRTTDDILVIATSKQDPARRGTGRLGVFGTVCP